jgi:NAD(P)-dependent dehydrogenase (short-subunit alcohol dehydrogenase family)
MSGGARKGPQSGGMDEPARAVLVTGACGGLGLAVVQALAERGFAVFAADSDREALARIEWPAGAVPLEMDVTDQGSSRRALVKVGRRTPALHGVVCAAGVFAGGPLVEADPGVVLRALDVNVVGAQRTAALAFPLLCRGGGTVVLISSEVVRCAVPFTGPYMMSKVALEAFAVTLRRELCRAGVRVVVVRSGAIATGLLAGVEASFAGMETGSAFGAQVRHARAALRRERERGMEPARAARVVVSALAGGRPRRLYSVGNDPGRAVLGLLPHFLADALIGRFMR